MTRVNSLGLGSDETEHPQGTQESQPQRRLHPPSLALPTQSGPAAALGRGSDCFPARRSLHATHPWVQGQPPCDSCVTPDTSSGCNSTSPGVHESGSDKKVPKCTDAPPTCEGSRQDSEDTTWPRELATSL